MIPGPKEPINLQSYKPLNLDDRKIIKTRDPEGMLDHVVKFDRQLELALRLSLDFKPQFPATGPRQVLFCGMGGSAVGADLVRAYLGRDLAVPAQVCRGYEIPAFAGEGTLALVCSYSGNTEETLSCFDQLSKTQSRIICLTSGGELAERAGKGGHDCFEISPGMQPRAALGFSFVPFLSILSRAGLIEDRRADIERMITLTARSAKEYGPLTSIAENRAKRLAQALQGSINMIYGSYGRLDAVARRWAGQLNENAKQLSCFNSIPELTHNEIEGWKSPPAETRAVFLDDSGDHERIRLRGKLMRRQLEQRGFKCTQITSQRGSWIERLWGLVLLGDYASVYLALLNGEDPTPVERIEGLKREMG